MLVWLKNHIKQNRYFYTPLLVFYLFGVTRLIFFSKIDNHLFFNQLVGNGFIDSTFKYLTYLGDGWFLISIAILWIFKNIRESVLLTIVYLLAGGLVALLKNCVFDEARPHFVFDYFYRDINVKYVDGVELLALNSFPSGHSTTAFVLFSFMAFHLPKNFHKLLMSFFAVLVAFSRVYLSQHWINDILAGSIIGLIITGICYYVFEKYDFFIQLNKPFLSRSK